LEGESVNLDGLEDQKLKASLKQLFQLAGLELVEMEADEEDSTEQPEDGQETLKSFGYTLPESPDKIVKDSASVNSIRTKLASRFLAAQFSVTVLPTVPFVAIVFLYMFASIYLKRNSNHGHLMLI